MTSGRPGPWASARTISRPGLEALRDPGLVAPVAAARPDPHGDVGDHAEHPLRADDELAQRRPGGGVRRLQRAQVAGRGDQPTELTSASKRP